VLHGSSGSRVGLVVAAAVVACGARTGLSVEVLPEAGVDAQAPSLDSGPPDASPDAPLDAPDTSLDAPPDVAPDAPLDSPVAETGDGCVGACACPPGTMAVGSSCLPIVGSLPAPRPLSPLSTARVTTATPVLAWQLPAGVDGAVVEICADRACTDVTTTFLAPGTRGSPATPLPSGMSFWRLLGTSSGSVGAAASPTWELLVPAQASTNVQTWWGSTLDVNGDGLADVGVGAPLYASYAGAAYVFTGQRGAGPAPTAVELDGPPTGSEFGCAIGSAGDLNGDGFAELVVGQCNLGSAAGGASAAYVYFGGPSGISPTAPSVLPAPMTGIAFGNAAASAGDTNADGYGDLVVGAGDGPSYLYLGGPAGIGTTPTPLSCAPGIYSGSAAASADVNGDGWGDLVVSGYDFTTFGGVACVFLGSAVGLSTTPVALPGPPTAGFGSLMGVGDVDADGYTDVMVGAFLFDGQSGDAYLFMGGPGGLGSPPVVVPNPHGSNGARFSVGLAGVHDVNGDGFDDFVLGAYLDGAGAAWLYLGGAAGLSPPVVIPDPAGPGAYYGNAAAGGDVDGDGYADVIVAAEGLGNNTGAVYWYRGSAAGLSPPMTVQNPHSTMAFFGWRVGL